MSELNKNDKENAIKPDEIPETLNQALLKPDQDAGMLIRKNFKIISKKTSSEFKFFLKILKKFSSYLLYFSPL